MSQIIPFHQGGDRPIRYTVAPIDPPPMQSIQFSLGIQNQAATPPLALQSPPPPIAPEPPSSPQWVELSWSVMGDRLPADHRYRLYSALVERMPELKNLDWQLNTITGIPDRHGWVKLGRRSHLLVRCRIDLVPTFGTLDRTLLRIGQSFIQLGSLEGNSVMPHDALESRLIIIKLNEGTRVDPFKFGVALGKQLQALGIDSMPEMGDRGCVQVKDHRLVGYAVRFNSLRPEESIKLQTHGIGGKRRMGCGVFVAYA